MFMCQTQIHMNCWCWELVWKKKDSHNQTRKLLAKAESRMYADKRAYYSALGIDCRK